MITARLEFVCNSNVFFATSIIGVLVSNVHDLYYCDENGIIFFLHIFAYYIELNAYFYSNMSVFIIFQSVSNNSTDQRL